MKKITIVLVVLSMILTVLISPNSVNGANSANTANTSKTSKTSKTVNAPIKLRINGQIADLKGYVPYKSTSGIMVPLAEASKAVGASVEYIKSTKEVKVNLNNTTLVFQAGSKFVLVNGKSLAMRENAVNIKGKVFVPVRFLFEKLGGTVGWELKTNCVVVNIKLPSENTTASSQKAPEIDDTSIPVSPDFKPYIAEMTPIDSDILKQLQAYKEDQDPPFSSGKSYYMSNTQVIEKVGLAKVSERCQMIKSFMEVENNVDYRTIGTEFIEQYRYFIMPDSDIGWTIRGNTCKEDNLAKLRYNDVKKYKIIEKAEYFTDTSLAYSNKNGFSFIRGRLKFMFESVDPQYFKDYGLPQYELNKWYNADMEVQPSIVFTGGKYEWPHSYYTYYNRFYLTGTKLWNGGGIR